MSQLLELRDVTASYGSVQALFGVSLSLREGEVLCIAGLVGSGRTELLRLIAGVDKADAGSVLVGGREIAGGDPRRRIRAGLGLLPEERKRDGIIRYRPVTANIALPAMHRFSRFGLIRRALLKGGAAAMAASALPAPMIWAKCRGETGCQPWNSTPTSPIRVTATPAPKATMIDGTSRGKGRTARSRTTTASTEARPITDQTSKPSEPGRRMIITPAKPIRIAVIRRQPILSL